MVLTLKFEIILLWYGASILKLIFLILVILKKNYPNTSKINTLKKNIHVIVLINKNTKLK